MSIHYQCPINKWGLLNNEYLIIKDMDGNIVDKQRWNDEKGFVSITTKGFKSVYLGDIKPKDVYQMFAIDSLNNIDFTLLLGVAGSAKTLLSLGWIMQNLQSGKIGKAIIIFPLAKLRNNRELGFYSGDRNQKLLQESLGGILSSKLGDMNMVETLINQGKLLLIPSSDIRGIEVSDNDCLFVTEAQNTDAYTMRTILQRAKEGCKIIIEGDLLEQTDIKCNMKNNGMLRAIEVFKGTKWFSCVKLKNTYRSPIAEIANDI
jgi:predicted ribonuclease YlaK